MQRFCAPGVLPGGANHYHETNSLGYLTAETIAETFGKMMGRV